MKTLSYTLILLLTNVVAGDARAAEALAYPAKAVRVIVAFAPGGGPDLVARVIAQQLAPLWGQQIVVDNRAGAGGIVGTDLAAKAPADGYTWVMVSSSFVMTAGLQKSLPYHPLKDFAPVTLASLYAVMLATLPSVLGHVKNGELKALAIGGAQRVAELPNVPTVAESGVAGYEASGWSGILTPAGTPPAIIGKINAAVGAILQSPDIQRRFAAQGATPVSSTPSEFSERIKADLTKWARVIRAAGIKIE